MLNLDIGSAQQVDGRSCILTGKTAGHAVYGPYEALEPGRYVVNFTLRPAGDERLRQDGLCAVLDVAADVGASILARKRVHQSHLADGRTAFALEFTISKPVRVEYRVWVSGALPLLIDEYRRAIAVGEDDLELAALLTSNAFPDVDDAAPAFFRDNVEVFRGLYEQGMRVSIVDGGTVLGVQGVSLNVRTADDLNFIGEIFHERAYNLKSDRSLTIIDVGMNIGLTSLMLATKAEVADIHAFEPFENTFDRAEANFRLNPVLSKKITAHNFGLSDRDWDGEMKVLPGEDSGARSTIPFENGQPVNLILRDAGRVLGPVIEAAEAAGRAVVVKLDCEGSEFAVMQSLQAAGLVAHIHAFMVEWHAMFQEHTQETLLAPLRACGFLIFDQSPPVGNGFFYAVRMP